jgi:hypothetical protein
LQTEIPALTRALTDEPDSTSREADRVAPTVQRRAQAANA